MILLLKLLHGGKNVLFYKSCGHHLLFFFPPLAKFILLNNLWISEENISWSVWQNIVGSQIFFPLTLAAIPPPPASKNQFSYWQHLCIYSLLRLHALMLDFLLLQLLYFHIYILFALEFFFCNFVDYKIKLNTNNSQQNSIQLTY